MSPFAFSTSSSSRRLTWRTLRATSDMPTLARSSSSSTTIGSTTSCSWKRSTAVGSWIRTLVSRTKSFDFSIISFVAYMNFCRKGAKDAKILCVKHIYFFASFAPLRQEILKAVQLFQYCFRVAGDLNAAKFFPQLAGFVEDEGRAVDAHVLLA